MIEKLTRRIQKLENKMTEKSTTDLFISISDNVNNAEYKLQYIIPSLQEFIYVIKSLNDNYTKTEIEDVTNYKLLKKLYKHANKIITLVKEAEIASIKT